MVNAAASRRETSARAGRYVAQPTGHRAFVPASLLAGFIAGKTLNANQIEFVNLITNHLTDHSVMEAARLYESPFTDLTPRGPEGLFRPGEVDDLIRVLDVVRQTAVAA
jgi:type I restriction enzyme R subunit